MPYIGNPITSGENNSFKVLDDITSYTLTFNGSSASLVSVANDTITNNSHRFITGQRVTYNTTGTAIVGLTAGTAYFIIKEDQNTIKLATTYANAINNTAIDLTGLGTGTTHTINVAFDGVNTKFKATYDNGTKAQITRAAQLTLSVNGVIQQPQDTTSPTNGFGIDFDSVIIFSVAPLVTDIFWGNLVANNFPTFDISDNTVDSFTGTGSLTTFTLSKEPANSQNLLVTIDGVVQYPSDNTNVRAYSVISNVLTFEGAPGNGTDIQVRHIGFAGATSSNVTGFYGRTGNVGLTTADNISVGNIIVSGITTVSAGSTSAPSISPTGDPNTGIFFPAADTISASTGGTSRITIDSSGNINIDNGTVFVDAANNRFGIGSTEPLAKLDVISSTLPQVYFSSSEEDGATKYLSIASRQRSNAAEPEGVSVIAAECSAGDNTIHIGGYLGELNAATVIKLYTANSLTTRSGSERFSINSTGTTTLTSATSTSPFIANIGASEAARIDSSGRFLVGTTAALNSGIDSQYGKFQMVGNAYSASDHGILTIGRGEAATAITNNEAIGFITFSDNVGNTFGDIRCIADANAGAGDFPGRLVFSTTADGASSPTERMRINSQGSARIGGTGDPGAIHIIEKRGVAVGTQVLTVSGEDESIRVYNASTFANPNGAAMVLWVRANNTTSRSINAAGTINASGADYAEYMVKAGNFTISKGAICGITADGLLTVDYDNAVSFAVKSTNPSYVGGDTWGAGFEDDSEGLETARQTVDRIAFAGQVPVNVMSATPGQYIVPAATENGGIIGISKDEADLTLAEYMRAVGKVIAIEDDGRARIIVKVA